MKQAAMKILDNALLRNRFLNLLSTKYIVKNPIEVDIKINLDYIKACNDNIETDMELVRRFNTL